MPGVATPTDRFQSFAERYVIERAGHYRDGNEKEDAWKALQDAKKIYDMIGEAARVRNGTEDGPTQAPSPQPALMQQRAAALQTIKTLLPTAPYGGTTPPAALPHMRKWGWP